ncbi:hypothetical protein MPSEU_000042500 [Mayamaea pseudoterrestris]|nr:hypothetical protein MPSEU_000042500 [Mayamaea pseudoterrestris]
MDDPDERQISTGFALLLTLISLLIVPWMSHFPSFVSGIFLRQASTSTTAINEKPSPSGEEPKTEHPQQPSNVSLLRDYSDQFHQEQGVVKMPHFETEAPSTATASPTTTLDQTLTAASHSVSNQAAVSNPSKWKCVCENGGSFLPASMLGPMAVMRMGTGQCYHKQ